MCVLLKKSGNRARLFDPFPALIILARYPPDERDACCPNQRDRSTSSAAHRPLGAESSSGPVLRHDLWRYQPQHRQDAERHDHQVIEISQHRNEVRDQVDGREGISGDTERKRLRIPRRARIASRKIDRKHLLRQRARPATPPRKA